MQWKFLPWLLTLSLSPWQAEADIEKQCQAALASLQQIPTLPQEPQAWLTGLDAWRLPARNTLNRAYVLADLSPQADQRQAARHCIRDLGKAFDKHRPSIRSQARERLDGAQGLEKQALTLWAGTTKVADSAAYTKAKAEARKLSQRFRQIIDKAEPVAVLPLSCAEKIKPSWQQADGWHVPLPAPSWSYPKLADDQCRNRLFVASESRLEEQTGPVLIQLLAKRLEMARLKGKDNYAQLRLDGSYLGSPDKVWAFLDKLSRDNKAKALKQWREAGDPPLWAEPRVTFKHRFRYQPKQVIQGWLGYLEAELGLRFVKTDQASWHPDVAHYRVFRGDSDLGELYLDLYERDGKYSHNRHRELRQGVTGVQLPSSVLELSLPRDEWGVRHLKSLMHESGHALNNLLASQPYLILAGIRLPSALVEVPAKVLEQLAWDPRVHKRITGQDRTPEPDPRQYGAGLDERIYKSALALALYELEQVPDRAAMDALNKQLFLKYRRRPMLDGMAHQYSFRHLATYGPNYFSYLYADDLADQLSRRLASGKLSLGQFSHCLLSAGNTKTGAEQLACALGEQP